MHYTGNQILYFFYCHLIVIQWWIKGKILISRKLYMLDYDSAQALLRLFLHPVFLLYFRQFKIVSFKNKMHDLTQKEALSDRNYYVFIVQILLKGLQPFQARKNRFLDTSCSSNLQQASLKLKKKSLIMNLYISLLNRQVLSSYLEKQVCFDVAF